MTTAKLAIDPLWQCLCPAWTSATTRAASCVLAPYRRPVLRCLQVPRQGTRWKTDAQQERWAARARDDGRWDAVLSPLADGPIPEVRVTRRREREYKPKQEIDYAEESTESLYGLLRIKAIDGEVQACRDIAELLVKERDESPNLSMYNALILSHVHTGDGSAWRVSELLDDIKEDGLQPDVQTCHHALKVLGIHVDHLLRTDVLEYMNLRWIQLSEDGAHDVAAGLLREGLLEQALKRLDTMREEDMQIKPWLLDMTVYVLCEANEISEAYKIMRQRFDSGEQNLSRSLWSFLLDKASAARHHAACSLVWNNQITQKYINPSSGICINVLATAAKAADAVMATEVFTHLTKRGTQFQPIHYEMLMSTYLSADPPDLKRAVTILTIMALEKLEPTVNETRPFYLYLRDKPHLVPQALETLRELHDQGRRVPIAALNVLIECYVEQANFPEALKIYKQIHTLGPASEGAQKTFATIETFNLLLKGCRTVDPPDAEQASFLVSELLALRIKPTSLTFDRLILVFTKAGQRAVTDSTAATDTETRAALRKKGRELIDWAFRHFADMRELEWMPRFGTVEELSIELARLGDARCWDVLQAGEDSPEAVGGWDKKASWARKKVEDVWTLSASDNGGDDDVVAGRPIIEPVVKDTSVGV